MSWQLGSLAILALAIVGGFAWYERSRPDARIVALVGTLAAFAALGRIAFAALPNVKPATDIVLISGYALGGAPGFVVGAVAAVTSNFFFGQGPWTPWQMAGWGATGVIGAGLGLITARARPGHPERIGRWPLALACAVTGFAFTALQDVGDWVTYSGHSFAQLGFYVGKGIGFDFLHAAGCLAFALAFGPSLARSVHRFASRLQVTWRTLDGPIVPVAMLVGLLVAVGGVASPARAAPSPTGYLLAAQNTDGGFGSGPGQPSLQLYSGWAALGLAAAGENPLNVARSSQSLLSYVQAGAGSLPDVGSLERTILVLRAAGSPTIALGGNDLVAELEHAVRPDGSVADQVNLTSFAVLALRAAGISPDQRTLSWLMHQQNSDGGFDFATAGGASDIDDTGAALQALAGAGGPAATALSRAVAFIRAQQSADGGFSSQPGAPSNAQSTAWAVQGLVAAGVDPGSLHRGGGASPLAFLRSLIASDGHVQYSRASDQTPVWVTGQALMALEQKPLPLATVPSRGPHHTSARRTRTAVIAAPRAAAAPNHTASKSRPAGTEHGRALLGLATEAGIAAALALAPIGLG